MEYNIVKELSDISWNVPESVYRADSALSQSTLGTYEREGFNNLKHLFDKKESSSLTFGSCVDSILTGGIDEFNERFKVIDTNLKPEVMATCKTLAERYAYEDFNQIPVEIVSFVAKECGFWPADKWSDEARYKGLLKAGNVTEYYADARQVDKVIISSEMYNDVLACVNALRTNTSTAGLFADNDELSPIRRYYQLKFKGIHNNVRYRGMLDLVIVDYEDKIVYPYDLKTSSSPEWDFEHSFLKWGYSIQARLYWRLLKANMMNDFYFKDFKLADYKFIVVNKATLTPLVWEFPLTQAMGTLIDEEGNEYRDPFVIGEELQGYLNLCPKVPNGITVDGVNTIKCLRIK